MKHSQIISLAWRCITHKQDATTPAKAVYWQNRFNAFMALARSKGWPL